ncbi:ferric reductase-like transmembrane domain-containing protein [Deinococcus alpinitundrae]|uniref:ferric reductase-like transmembrane domain-containing protein n=1 Tax=Deinococcus alpinitundrae TaxID=468913 RepID=UPI00137AFEE9|nr:ferric reductase-like transmembrane domain-containing protein [Deinococcus alpinitundrae]
MTSSVPVRRSPPVSNTVTGNRINTLLSLLLAALLLIGFILSALNLGAGTLAGSLLRATGIVAYLALALSVNFGALLGSRYAPAWLARAQQYGWHGLLSGFALILGTAHGVFLAVDGTSAQPLTALLLPWISTGATLAMCLGTLGMYSLALVYLSTVWRKRLSQKQWRALHLTAYPAFVVLTLHSILAGTDSLGPLYGVAVAGAVLTFGLRFLEETGKRVRQTPPNQTRAAEHSRPRRADETT